MSEGPKLLLVDANNMAHRVFWTHKSLKHGARGTGLLFGFMKGLVSLHKDYPDHFRIIAWDGGYARRLAESTAAVESGLIPSAYKATRDREMTPELEEFMEQREQLRTEILPLIRCLQVVVDGVEADDVIYSYGRMAEKWNGNAVIVSSDLDFFQALDDHTIIRDPMKKETWTRERFELEFGFSPELWVDVGAIEGEVGPSKDNIHGVPGWGKVNARKYVREHGNLDNVIASLQAKTKRSKKEQTFLDNLEVLRLAFSLKKMDEVVVPKPRLIHDTDAEEIKKCFFGLGFASLAKDVWRFV